MKRDPYTKGFYDGLKQAKSLVKQDIAHIYGIMCVILIESGNTADECENLLMQIQERWQEVAKTGVEEYLKEKLPFDIVQMVIGDE